MDYQQVPPGKDPEMWQLAQRRASFKSHFITYLIMSVLFWVIWYISGGRTYNNGGLPWPVWPMFGWGIGIVFHYFGAYVAPKSNATQNEYDKLMKEKKQNF